MTHISPLVQRARFCAEFVLVCVVVIVPVFIQAGIIPSFFPSISSAAAPQEYIEGRTSVEASVLRHVGGIEQYGAQGGSEIFVTEGVLVATGPAGEDEIATTRLTNGEISVYTVRPGDSLSQIAEMYGVTTNTILWANDLSSATAIRPGDALIILPIAGVQHTVTSGDTVSSIAKKYEGDEAEILAYNQLSSNNSLTVGETVVVPGGRIQNQPTPSPSATARAPQPTRQTGSVSSSGGLTHPLPGSVRTQGIHGYNAVDFGAAVGVPIRAAAAGEVIVSRNSGWNGGYGNYIVIRHPNGMQTLYAHNSRNSVGVGEYVSAGQTIGYVGNTGRSTGPHLHFEVRGGSNPF